MPATPGPSEAGNVQAPQKTVRYIRIPARVTKTTYNLRPATLNNVTASNTPATVTSTPFTAGRGQNNPQTTQVKQEPPTPGGVATPKTTSTTTVVRKGKGRGKRLLLSVCWIPHQKQVSILWKWRKMAWKTVTLMPQ